jgi:hypothetical protein
VCALTSGSIAATPIIVADDVVHLLPFDRRLRQRQPDGRFRRREHFFGEQHFGAVARDVDDASAKLAPHPVEDGDLVAGAEPQYLRQVARFVL